jgi:hypothetical protein
MSSAYLDFFLNPLKMELMAKSKLPAGALDYFRKQGRRGGKLSAAARMEKLTPERRSEIAKKAVAAREAKRATALKDSQDSPYPFPPPQILLPKLSERKGGKARAKKAVGASARVRSAKAKAGAAKAHGNPMTPTKKKG